MDSGYLNHLTNVLKGVRARLAVNRRLEFKNSFGAVAGYVDGRIFISCGRFGVALRLPPDCLAELFREEDVSRLRYFKKGHVKKEYAVIPKRIIDDRNRFRQLVDISLRFVS